MKNLLRTGFGLLLMMCLLACNQQGSTTGTYAFTPPKVVQDSEALAAADEAPAPQASYLQKEVKGENDQGLVSPPAAQTEDYSPIVENEYLATSQHPLSTFSIDVDRASYSNVRRFIEQGILPPAGAVRIEEMINYFNYSYAAPTGQHPLQFTTEVNRCPWNPQHQLLLIGLQGRQMPADNLPPANLVFLVDVSGSMEEANKLPLVQQSLRMLIDQLRPQDRMALVVYAGEAGLVLPSTPGTQKQTLKDAVDRLQAGGSTAGSAGIELAYRVARQGMQPGSNNRVVLCTDGDFNVGPSSDDELVSLIEKERASGVFLTVLGYGMGNYKDNKMQLLADKGNGNHAYIDNAQEARKTLLEEFGGTLFTIAKDVKLQVEFNPAVVQAYRLVGYENRLLADEDFNDDTKDAGELGSGHSVTALYEIIPAGAPSPWVRGTDSLRYQRPAAVTGGSSELATIKFRYKEPDGQTSKLLVHTVTPAQAGESSNNFRFAAAVAEFGLLLRNSRFKAQASLPHAIALARSAQGPDEGGYRAGCIALMHQARSLMPGTTAMQQR